MTKTRELKVALALPDFQPWGMAAFFNGIREYAREHAWRLTQCPVDPESAHDLPLDWPRLTSWKADGIILQSNNPKQLKRLQKLDVPFVNISEEAPIEGIRMGRLGLNNQMIGRLAFEHLSELGLKHLVFHGVQGRLYSDERFHGFQHAARAAGVKVNRFCLPHMTRDALWNERYQPIVRWLKTLPLPVGIFAVHDFRALFVLSACQDVGLRVPEDVAVVGVDNDLLVCDSCIPTLSSVCINAQQMGLEAAKLLDRLIHGEPPPPVPVRINPSHVCVRASTDILHIEDPVVSKAVNFMREHYSESFKMDVVAAASGASRRSMETRFRAERKTTPAKFLADFRVKKAKSLLASSARISAEAVARACGFGTGKNLRAALRRIANASPKDVKPH